ncbi:maltose O-acetyltransferase [Abditibacterium utsteinense]|uniref:Maltose O-acetyltransferase n=1 Tax=Abditibacterium utsteinense TaxID=1960156 RepID=A0A2S8STH8_9BACT|nr:maltose O-acetyltransferase [Abditibacterium utsteinense]
MTEKELMLSGQLYDAGDPELVKLRLRARQVTRAYNSTNEDQRDIRRTLLNRLLGQMPPKLEIEPPFRCDYGWNIHLGQNFYANFGVVMLDVCEIRIGENVLLAPGVQIYTAHHPISPEERLTGRELGSPVTIGNNVWIGGNAIILPGVSIGDNSIIGAGSVVTKDVPANVIAAGNPCRVLREL